MFFEVSSLFICVMAMFVFSCKEKAHNVRITYYHQEREAALDPELPGFWDLIKEAEDLLVTADGILRLDVPPELIDKIKREEIVIEIIYPRPIELTLKRNRYTIHPDRLLIPLSGEFVGRGENPQAVIFHGYPAYSAGPYTNSEGIGKLKRILLKMGIK